jgi:hypothetical protein
MLSLDRFQEPVIDLCRNQERADTGSPGKATVNNGNAGFCMLANKVFEIGIYSVVPFQRHVLYRNLWNCHVRHCLRRGVVIPNGINKYQYYHRSHHAEVDQDGSKFIDPKVSYRHRARVSLVAESISQASG